MNDPRIDWANAVACSSGRPSTASMNHLPRARAWAPNDGQLGGGGPRHVEVVGGGHDPVDESEPTGLVGGDASTVSAISRAALEPIALTSVG